MMKLDVPLGTTYYWNPYSPKLYTIVHSASPSSDDEGSFGRCSSIGSPCDDLYDLGWSAIHSVRQETTDAAVNAMVHRLPYKTLMAMVSVLENSPSLFLELCERERGNVVAHIIGALKGNECQELVNFTAGCAIQLSKNQSGCIAMTRIFDGCSPSQQTILALSVMQEFHELLTHPYGNFVLSRIVQGASPLVYDYVTAELEREEVLIHCVNNKFGSHVFEAFVKDAPAECLFRVCHTLLRDPNIILMLATSTIANYPLQAALRQMLTRDSTHELSRWALTAIPALVVDTKFSTNINRALGFRPTKERATKPAKA